MAGKNTFGGTVKLEGESEYKKALRDITSDLKVLSSEMNVVTATYGKNNNGIASLTDKHKVLSEQISKQKEKVETLKGALEKSKEIYGENSTQTKNWQVALNKAEAELVGMENELKNNDKAMDDYNDSTNKQKKELDEFGHTTEDVGQKTLTLGDIIKANLISEAIKKGISELAGAMKKVGSVLIDVGKQALESYGDYEQLVGGVDTLFKESSNTVQQYAQNSYKTAGLSANEYMETVTSFSASLLQSLNNDTEKSAKVADMAITDMSDNANKMGTSMESIQNAYQGFAKQNYTMLDNLKLGYGGTKSEMERLLADAEKISGVKYDISNLSDVYSAIHVIQTELDITGTTAKESSTTIQGSMNSLKSAWQNMLVGIADDNANFEGLTNNLVESLGTVLENLLPRIQTILGGLGDLIVSIADKILPQMIEIGINTIGNLVQGISSSLPQIAQSIQTIVTTLLGGLTQVLPQLVPIAVQVIQTLVTSLISMLPEILQAGITIITELALGLAQMLPTLIPQMVDAVILMTETLIDNIDLIIDAGIQLILGLADGLIQALPRLIEKIPVIIQKLVMAIANNLPKIVQAGINLVIKLASGLIQAIPQLLQAIPKIISSIVSGFGTYFSKMGEIGLNLVKGIWNGISNATQWILDKIKGFGQSVLDGIKSFFGIHSPSTLFQDEVGKNLALGVGLGFEQGMDKVTKEMQDAIPTTFDTNVDMNMNNTSRFERIPNSEISFANMFGEFISRFEKIYKVPSITINTNDLNQEKLDLIFREIDRRFGLAYN